VIPALPGTYALVMRCTASRRLAIGRLGALEAAPGYYIYTGSALGPGGLAARVRRHLRTSHIVHWHVDYLRPVLSIDEVWYCVDGARHEHAWALGLAALPGVSIPLARFGASDCRCPAHLFHTAAEPGPIAFQVLSVACGVTMQRLSIVCALQEDVHAAQIDSQTDIQVAAER
jgi:Uri superfamily endonuclease